MTIAYAGGSTVAANLTGTSVSVALPSSLTALDGLFALIFTDSLITSAPAGWTLVGSQGATGGSQHTYIYVYQKDDVEPADSDTTAGPWTRTNVGYVSVALLHCQGSKGVLVENLVFNHLDNTAFTIDLPDVTASIFMDFFYFACLSLQFDGVTAPPTSPGYLAQADVTAPSNGRHLWGAQSLNAGQKPSTVFSSPMYVMQPGSSTTNALVSMTMRLQDVAAVTVHDNVGITSDLLHAPQFALALADSMGLAEPGLFLSPIAELIDSFTIENLFEISHGYATYATDAIGVGTDVISIAYGGRVLELIGVLETMTPKMTYGVVTQETLQLAGLLSIAYPQAITDGIGVAHAVAALQAAIVIERLGLTDLVEPLMTYGITVQERIKLTDGLRRFFGADAYDNFGVLDDLLLKATTFNSISENLGLSDTLDKQMVFRVLAADTIEIQADQLLHMIFNGQATDGVEIAALYLAPNNSITTFAINPKKGAVTEYGNYNFNSFAQIGHKYLGASSTGLYELNGPDDAGTPIIAHIKGGFMQFGQMHLSSIKGIYLGIRGDGDFLLKIEDGAGHSYTYGLKAKHFETTRVRPGKGLRARFFRFELISTGQDFDLEAIEFLPIVDKRRG